MPSVLRKVVKNRWYKTDRISWLPVGEMPADVFLDLKTTGNTLSFWVIKDDGSNLDQVLLALAANKDSFDTLDFAIFDIDLLETLQIKHKKCDGDTLDPEVNQEYHIDAIELTAEKAYKLAQIIWNDAKKERRTKGEMKRAIMSAVKEKRIALTSIKDELRERLDLS